MDELSLALKLGPELLGPEGMGQGFYLLEPAPHPSQGNLHSATYSSSRALSAPMAGLAAQ